VNAVRAVLPSWLGLTGDGYTASGRQGEAQHDRCRDVEAQAEGEEEKEAGGRGA